MYIFPTGPFNLCKLYHFSKGVCRGGGGALGKGGGNTSTENGVYARIFLSLNDPKMSFQQNWSQKDNLIICFFYKTVSWMILQIFEACHFSLALKMVSGTSIRLHFPLCFSFVVFSIAHGYIQYWLSRVPTLLCSPCTTLSL